MPANRAYDELQRRFARLAQVDGAMSVLSWDAQTMMPPGGAEARAAQMATLRALYHEMLTDAAMKGLLDTAEGDELDDWQRANLREMRRDWIHASAIPSRLVEEHSLACSACEQAWRAARPAADFARVRTELAEVLRLTREIAKIKGEALGVSPYDALLDQYEPGARSRDIEALFADLGAFLPGFLAEVLKRQAPPRKAPAGPFPEERQRALGLRMMEALGFDFDHGRLDTSRHPFSGGVPDDVRITTRYDERDFLGSLMGVLHETGHAMYERGLPAAWRGQPVGRARGMAMHESQSLLIEMQAGRSQGFLGFLAPAAAAAFDRTGEAGWDAETLRACSVRVSPGFIRVDADEVTYPAHVILRYRLEKAMVQGGMEVDDLPAAWNKGMAELLGITPPDDRLGCLQDLHWYDGGFGYFPCYTLGAMTAAQIFDAARRAVPGLEDAIAAGDFAPLFAWLRPNVHGMGSKLSTADLLTRATGRPLDPAVFKEHLRRRYLS